MVSSVGMTEGFSKPNAMPDSTSCGRDVFDEKSSSQTVKDSPAGTFASLAELVGGP